MKRETVHARIAAAVGEPVVMKRAGAGWVPVSESEAQALQDDGRGAEVQRVYTKAPDFDAFVWLVDQCAPDVQDRVWQRIRLAFRRRPEIITRGIAAQRRAVRDPATSAKERRLAQRFLEKHGFDDAGLARED